MNSVGGDYGNYERRKSMINNVETTRNTKTIGKYLYAQVKKGEKLC